MFLKRIPGKKVMISGVSAFQSGKENLSGDLKRFTQVLRKCHRYGYRQ